MAYLKDLPERYLPDTALQYDIRDVIFLLLHHLMDLLADHRRLMRRKCSASHSPGVGDRHKVCFRHLSENDFKADAGRDIISKIILVSKISCFLFCAGYYNAPPVPWQGAKKIPARTAGAVRAEE